MRRLQFTTFGLLVDTTLIAAGTTVASLYPFDRAPRYYLPIIFAAIVLFGRLLERRSFQRIFGYLGIVVGAYLIIEPSMISTREPDYIGGLMLAILFGMVGGVCFYYVGWLLHRIQHYRDESQTGV